MPTALRFTRMILRMLSGALIWASHFAVIYIFTALACARGFWDLSWLGIGVVAWVIGAATLAATLAASAISVQAMHAARNRTVQENATGFVHWMTSAIGGLSLVAIVWEAVPVLLVPTCG